MLESKLTASMLVRGIEAEDARIAAKASATPNYMADTANSSLKKTDIYSPEDKKRWSIKKLESMKHN